MPITLNDMTKKPMRDINKDRITIRVEDEMMRWVEKVSNATGISNSNILRHALHELRKNVQMNNNKIEIELPKE